MDPDVMKAIALIDNGQVNEAVTALEAIVKKDPKNEQALVELAMIHLLDLKDPEQAIGYLQKAVVVAPANQVVMSELVSLYDEQQRLEDGVAFLQDVEKQQPGSPDVAYGLGQLLSLAGRDAESIPYLERAAQQGDPVRAYRDLAEAYARTGDSERAIDSYDKALQSMDKELEGKRAQGLPAAYVEERIHYTKLDKARELIRMNDLDGAQRLLDEVGQQMPGDEGVTALQQNLNQKRAG
jgi:FimV-like protein